MTGALASRPRVLIVAGYFDWFSGYQETALAAALSQLAEVHVVASDRVSPGFSHAHLERLGLPRRYPSGSSREHGITVTRLPSVELRSMVWSYAAVRRISEHECDLIIQVMPGQLLSAAPSFTRHPARKLVLYGDNRAMWADLPMLRRVLKAAAFTVSKGILYAFVNRRADTTFGYTPDTQHRLRPFAAGHTMRLMPLCFSSADFHPDEAVRASARRELGYAAEDIVILSAGKFDRRKRLEWLVGAFDQVAQSNARVRLLMVGDDGSGYSEELRRTAAGISAAKRVRLQPFASTPELNRLFNAADLGVWPRNPAITIQQAMATGMAVVLPSNDLVGHLLHAQSGCYFDLQTGNETARLAEAIGKVVDHGEFTMRARRRRADDNSWMSAEATAQRLLQDERTDRRMTDECQ